MQAVFARENSSVTVNDGKARPSRFRGVDAAGSNLIDSSQLYALNPMLSPTRGARRED